MSTTPPHQPSSETKNRVRILLFVYGLTTVVALLMFGSGEGLLGAGSVVLFTCMLMTWKLSKRETRQSPSGEIPGEFLFTLLGFGLLLVLNMPFAEDPVQLFGFIAIEIHLLFPLLVTVVTVWELGNRYTTEPG